MQINKMRLINYRNYKDVAPVFSPGINILYGDNGQGKTNLLESIYLSCRGYSHRTGSTRDLIRFDSQTMFMASEFLSENARHKVSLKAVGGKKGWNFDGKSERSFAKIQPFTGSIVFEPEDLGLVKGSPEIRRRFMNWEIASLFPAYKKIYREYERVRLQRNALLRQFKASNPALNEIKSVLEPWDRMLVEQASQVFLQRSRYIRDLEEAARQFHHRLSGSDERLDLSYLSNSFDVLPDDLEEIQALYRDKLSQNLTYDLEKGYTRLGPHADDLLVNVNSHPARLYASQGQQRTAAISLKLSHIGLYREKLGIEPVVLLDDVLSELDDKRQKNILSVLEGAQTFITCTNPSFSSGLSSDLQMIHINDGNLS